MLADEKCVTYLPLTHLLLCNVDHHLHKCVFILSASMWSKLRARISNNESQKISFTEHFIWRQVKLATISENLLERIVCERINYLKFYAIDSLCASRQIRKGLLFSAWNYREHFFLYKILVFSVIFFHSCKLKYQRPIQAALTWNQHMEGCWE